MKNFILPFIFLALIACDVEEDVVPNSGVETASATPQKVKSNNLKTIEMRVLYIIDEDPNFPPLVKCPWLGGNCFPTIVINGLSGGVLNSDIMEGIIDDIKISTPSEIITLFEDNETFLKTYIDDDLVDDAIAGTYTVLAPEPANVGESFITFGTSSSLNDVYRACQFDL